MGNIDWDKLISENWGHIPNIRERFAKIQENPALYGAENGFTAQGLEELEKLLAITGEVNLAGNEITNKYLAGEIDEERRQRHAKTNRTGGTTQTRGKDREEF